MSPAVRGSRFQTMFAGMAFDTPAVSRGMGSVEFTRYLTQPKTPTGGCHCGQSGLMFPEYGPSPATGRMVLRGWHCLQCRCDEHTPETHAMWSKEDRKPTSSTTRTSLHPGCGRTCTRGEMDVLVLDEFPTFEEWLRTNGSKALRDAARS